MIKFAFLLLAALACLVSAQQQHGNTNYQMFDANGFPTAEAIALHGPYILGVSPPGWMLLLNSTLMHNHEPGVTTYEDISRSYTYQVNGVERVDNRWRMTHHQFINRYEKVWAYAKWVDDVNNPQIATPPYAGAGNEQLLQSYNIRAIEPIMFEYLGATVLEMKARLLSDYSYIATYNLRLPGIRLNVMDETVALTAETLDRLAQGDFTGKEFYYSINIYQGTHNRFPDWGHIYRPEFQCAGSTGLEAEACECYQRMLNNELELRNDPLAAAAGYYHEIYICDLNDPSVPAKRDAPIDQVRWPSNPLAASSYDVAYKFNLAYNDHPMRYVPGMPATREEHNARFFGTEQQ